MRTEDKIGNWAVDFSPKLGVGHLVSPNEPFKNSFIGNIPNTTHGLYIYEEMAHFKPGAGLTFENIKKNFAIWLYETRRTCLTSTGVVQVFMLFTGFFGLHFLPLTGSSGGTSSNDR